MSGQCISTRFEIADLNKRLREKEYILAPGVLNFTPASPMSVSDSYISDAVTDFISDLGNVSPSNIEEQYARLMRFMSKPLRIRFEMDMDDWLARVKEDNISQIMTIRQKEIKSDDKGSYKVISMVKVDLYSHKQYLGYEDQVVEMALSLVPPQDGQRWSLQIDSLFWNKAATYKTKDKVSCNSSNQPISRQD